MKIAMGMALWGVLSCAPLFVLGDESTNTPVGAIPAPTSVPGTNTPAQAGPNDPNPYDQFSPKPNATAPSSQVIPATEAEAVQWLAEKGDAKAQNDLGVRYRDGDGFEKSPVDAAKWFQKAADQGYAPAEANLGICYTFGNGVIKDPKKAMIWYSKAAEQGDPLGEYHLGFCYEDTDSIQAMKWFRKAADQSYPDAEYYVGLCYNTGNHVEKNVEEAQKWFQRAADAGDADAKSSLAELEQERQDRQKIRSAALAGDDYALGEYAGYDIEFLKKQADAGDMVAIDAIGLRYELGLGGPVNASEAVKWYRKAAELDFAPAEASLGTSYEFGRGIEKNDVEAAKWYQKAADQQYALGEFDLGHCYEFGVGVDRNPSQAKLLYQSAANQGNVFAEFYVGKCYQFGIGIGEDFAEASKWYLKAATKGDSNAEEYLGLLYCNGLGVIKNEVEGLGWLYVAAANGNRDASLRLPTFEKFYGGEIVAAARARATEIQGQISSQGGKSAATTPSLSAQQPSSPKTAGSGAFISSDGLVLTAAHVVQGASRIDVVTATGSFACTVVKIDVPNDIAVLKCSGNNFTPLPIATSKGARAGETVFTVGFPNIQLQGFDPKLTKGEISSEAGFQDDPRQWQISVPIQPGNSGGPLCDENGNLIGIVESTLNPLTMAKVEGEIPQNVNYAVKSSYILPLLDDVQNLPPPFVPANGAKFEDTVSNVQKSVVLILVY
jgi:TPR repeat protein